MKKQRNFTIQKLCVIAGFCLLSGALVALGLWQWNIHTSAKKAQSYVALLQILMPPSQNAVVEARRDNTMPSFCVDGTDFVGIIEMPRYASVLPVCADWGDPNQYPCLFDGSIYNRTIKIGTTSQKGQYDFYAQISVGDSLFFTDMEGNRFCYEVADIRYEKHADQAALRQKDAALTLFVKNVYSLEYILIFCNPIH